MIDLSGSKPPLMAVLAHPDDESFGMGGTLALYARQGYPVHLVCATRGEAGDCDPQYLEGFDSVATRREAELRCAAGILRLAGVHFLDYRDSGMPGSPDNQHPQALVAAPLEEAAGRVVHYLRSIRPQVVVTFDPIGGYKHPDHIAIHKATVLACELAGDPNYVTDLPPFRPARLYFQVFPTGFLRLAVRVLPVFGQDPHHFGRNGDIDLAALAEESNFPIHARINCRSVAQEKAAASACHSSQMGGGPRRNSLTGKLMEWFDRSELYMRAYPPPEAGLHEKDLFA
jgi:N-acetyl-1-D-myo-inositol-2-amino-2-deoxy-alpha-D-glucopyranoside deacetylase